MLNQILTKVSNIFSQDFLLFSGAYPALYTPPTALAAVRKQIRLGATPRGHLAKALCEIELKMHQGKAEDLINGAYAMKDSKKGVEGGGGRWQHQMKSGKRKVKSVSGKKVLEINGPAGSSNSTV